MHDSLGITRITVYIPFYLVNRFEAIMQKISKQNIISKGYFFIGLLLVSGFTLLPTILSASPLYILGVDAQVRHQNFKPDFGKNLFKKYLPQGNFYGGLKFNEWVGVEVGYTTETSRVNTVRLGQGERGLGYVVNATTAPGNDAEIHKYMIKFKGGAYVNLVGYSPSIFDCVPMQLFGSIGVASREVRIEDTLLTGLGVILSSNEIEDERRFVKAKKGVLQIGGGLIQMLTNYVGVRAMVKWENTSKFKQLYLTANNPFVLVPANDIPAVIASLKDSTIYSIGLFVNF